MNKLTKSLILAAALLVSFSSLGYCVMDGPIYQEKNVSYADFGVTINDTGSNGNSCEIRVQQFPATLDGSTVTGHMVVNSYIPFTGNIISSGGTNYHVTLGNGGGLRAPVKLHIEPGGIAFIYFISDDPNVSGEATCIALADNIFINRVKLVAEP